MGEFVQGCALFTFVDEVLVQEQFAFFLVQPLAPGVGSGFADGMRQGPGENQPGTPAAADPLQEAIRDEPIRQRFENLRNRSCTADRVQNQEMSRIVEPHFFLTNPLQVSKEGWILNHAVKSEGELIGRGVRGGELLGAGDGVLEDQVHTLPGAFHHPAALEDLRKAAVSGGLAVKQRLHGDLWEKPARTLDRERGRGVPDEDAAPQQIVAVADGIEDGFAHRALGKGRQLSNEEPGLEGLPRVAAGLVDLQPEYVVPGKEPFLELMAQVGWSRGSRVAVLINQLGLGQVLADGLPGAKEDQGRVDQGAIVPHQFRIPQKLLMGKTFDPLSVASTGFLAPRAQRINPRPTESIECNWVEITERQTGARLGGIVPTDFLPDDLPTSLGQGDEAVILPHPSPAIPCGRKSIGMSGHCDDENTTVERLEFLPMGREMDALIEAFTRDLDLRPNLSAYNPARALIRNTEHDFASTFIGQSTCVFGQTVEVVLGFPLLELVVFPFDPIENLLETWRDPIHIIKPYLLIIPNKISSRRPPTDFPSTP